MIRKPNFIIIGSTGRNTGKTEFACRLIQQFARAYKIVGLKVEVIEPGELELKADYICNSENKPICEIFEETSRSIHKDTSRMLDAGAHIAYLLKVDRSSLEAGFEALLERLPDDAMVVCESNSLRRFVEPSLFLVIKNAEDTTVKESCTEVIEHANKVIEFHNVNWDFQPNRVQIKDGEWILQEKATAIILAGGKSARMGEDKHLLPVNGIPLVQHIANQLKGHFDEIIIGANNPEHLAFTGLKIISDIEQDKGPLMGIYSCLKASSNDINFITACDIPVINTQLIHNMIQLSPNYDIVIPVAEPGNYEPLYAIYRKSVVKQAKALLERNSRRIIDLLNGANVKYVDFKDQEWYQNLNLKDDYLLYLNRLNDSKGK